MTSADPLPVPPLAAAELAELRHLVNAATQRLLGDTIGVDDEQWRTASRLPGWTRGHVATHIARQAGGLVRVVSGARSGQVVPMYATPEQRNADIEAGAPRPGLELQIDLDTSAGALTEAFEDVQADGMWDRVVELRGATRVPMGWLPAARLFEVVLHHVDLQIGFEMTDVDSPTADWLLRWVAVGLAGRSDVPRIAASTPTLTVELGGAPGEPVPVSGPAQLLVGWLTGRSPADGLEGAEQVTLPAY